MTQDEPACEDCGKKLPPGFYHNKAECIWELKSAIQAERDKVQAAREESRREGLLRAVAIVKSYGRDFKNENGESCVLLGALAAEYNEAGKTDIPLNGVLALASAPKRPRGRDGSLSKAFLRRLGVP